MRWTFDIEAAQGQVVTSSITLRSDAPARGLVLSLSGVGFGDVSVPVVTGARWSEGLSAFYTYLGGEPSRMYERAFTFEAPVTAVGFQLMMWPSREPVAPSEVVSHVLQLSAWDRSVSVDNAAVLVLPRPDASS